MNSKAFHVIMNADYFHSLDEYEPLSSKYFKYENVPPPLVKKSWISKIEEEEDEIAHVVIAEEIQVNKCINRKRGRPKKIRPENSLEEKEPDVPFWFNDESNSTNNSYQEPDWGDIPESQNFNQPDQNTHCDNTFEAPCSPRSLVIDEQKHTKVKTRISRLFNGLSIQGIKSETGVIFPCPECSKRFKALSTLKNHYRIHSGELLHCEVCARSFTSKYLLKCHQRVHTGDLFTCTECFKGFTTAELLKVHKRGHTGEKPFKCTECSKSFRSTSNLSQHKETHFSDRRFLCPQCGASFNQRRCLEGHMAVHGDKNHICTVCGKQWARKSDLVEHMRIHTGDKPFQCQFCDHKFTQASSLKRHILVHQESTIACQLCDKKFRHETYYARHLKKHSPTKEV